MWGQAYIITITMMVATSAISSQFECMPHVDAGREPAGARGELPHSLPLAGAGEPS
jgi:hypothetical protein